MGDVIDMTEGARELRAAIARYEALPEIVIVKGDDVRTSIVINEGTGTVDFVDEGSDGEFFTVIPIPLSAVPRLIEALKTAPVGEEAQR